MAGVMHTTQHDRPETNVRVGRRALLVYPEFPEDSYLNFGPMHRLLMPLNRHGFPKTMMPPLGLICILGPIRERYGQDRVRLIDMNIQPLRREDLEWADDVYIGGMLTQCVSYDMVASQAKALGKTTIGGGPYADADHEHLDHVFINESEYTLGPFLDDLFAGVAQRVYEGRRPEPEDFFHPDFSALELSNYSSMAIQFSRGCPHDCEFCDITSRFGRKMRTRDVSVFLEELDDLYALGWRGQVFIIDDNFIGKPAAAQELLEALTEWQKSRGYPFEFFTQATVLLAEPRNDALLRAFAPAGFSMIFLGIESPNEESLAETNKLHNLRPGSTLVEKLHRIQEVGEILILGGFVLGFDNDKIDIFDRQIEFIQEIRLPTPTIAMLSPLPETKLEKRLKEESRIVGKVASGHDVTFVPKNLTAHELLAGYKKVLKAVYTDMDGFYARCLGSLKCVRAPRRLFNEGEFLAVFRLLYHEGVRGQRRWAFWKYFGRMVLQHPTKLPYGLRWAAYGMHYRLLTERLTAPVADPVPAMPPVVDQGSVLPPAIDQRPAATEVVA